MKKAYSGVAALTIVSKNYISFARVLCDSFLRHHPCAQFFVVLVDKNEGFIDEDAEQFTLLSFLDVGIPSPDIFPYQYNILELNTAVKPYALKYLLDHYSIEKLAYIDPDIMIFDAMDKVWGNLEENSIVITPHIRQPYDDECSPSELSIIQSGTYNLGFIGLSNNDTARRLLDWWAERLYLNCVVDIARGLFTDQKWIDLVPGYFPDTYILHSPEYNVAYWNLHERELSAKGKSFFVDGSPLVFFHFSGYNPKLPKNFSKHQNRHDLSGNPSLEKLCNIYRAKLLAAGSEESGNYEYFYSKLPNGVQISNPIHKIIRRCLAQKRGFPSPAHAPNEFCEFISTPNCEVYGSDVAPLLSAIIEIRPDLNVHYPNAYHDKNDRGIVDWFAESGVKEYKLNDFDKFISNLTKKNSIKLISDIYYSRPDLIEVFPTAFVDRQGYIDFVEWLEFHGVQEYDSLSQKDIDRFKRSVGSVAKVLNYFFERPDLQKSFYNLSEYDVLDGLRSWFLSELPSLSFFTQDEIEYFCVWGKHNNSTLKEINLMYNVWIRSILGCYPNIFDIEKVLDTYSLLQIHLSASQVVSWLLTTCAKSPIQHIAAHYLSSNNLKSMFPDALSSKSSFRKLFEFLIQSTYAANYVDSSWVDLAFSEIDLLDTIRKTVNIAGYFDAVTGMGESSRSLKREFLAEGRNVSVFKLPNAHTDQDHFDYINDACIYGSVNFFAELSVVVANADATAYATEFFPFKCLSGKKVGYWVWETEKLPEKWSRCGNLYDEIWTPSKYSLDAIARTINKTVLVKPHNVDVERIKKSKPNREKFNLPESAYIFGYFFDQKSYLDRKNPEAAIQAFDKAFSGREDVYLLLKVSKPRAGDFKYECLKSKTENKNIIWMECELSRDDTYSLMSSLDAYVSLHRSEGFGLTMAEAMAMEKPVIASAYSGNLEFMNDQNSYLVKTKAIKIEKAVGPYKRGDTWGEPDISDAVDKMKAVLSLFRKETSNDIEVELLNT